MTTTPDPTGRSWPDFMTVEQAASVLCIGRNSAYRQARKFLATSGAEGIPAIRVGNQLRVPRAHLERWHGGPLTPPPAPKPNGPKSRPAPRRKARPKPPTLPFEG